jgi:hypothetical protein
MAELLPAKEPAMTSTTIAPPGLQGAPAHRARILKVFVDQGSAGVWAYASDITKATGLWAAEVDHQLDVLRAEGRISRRARPAEANIQPAGTCWVFVMTPEQYQWARNEVGLAF